MLATIKPEQLVQQWACSLVANSLLLAVRLNAMCSFVHPTQLQHYSGKKVGSREEQRDSEARSSTAILKRHTISSSTFLCEALLHFSSPYVLQFPTCLETHSLMLSFQRSEVQDWSVLSLIFLWPNLGLAILIYKWLVLERQHQNLSYHAWQRCPSEHYRPKKLMSGIIGIKAQSCLLKKKKRKEKRVNPELVGAVLLIHRTSLCLPLCSITLSFLTKTASIFDSFLNTNLPVSSRILSSLSESVTQTDSPYLMKPLSHIQFQGTCAVHTSRLHQD